MRQFSPIVCILFSSWTPTKADDKEVHAEKYYQTAFDCWTLSHSGRGSANTLSKAANVVRYRLGVLLIAFSVVQRIECQQEISS